MFPAKEAVVPRLVRNCALGRGIHRTDNEDEIEGRTDKVKGLVLRTEFLKKA